MPPVISTSGGAHGACRGFLRRYHTDRQTGLGDGPHRPQRVRLRAEASRPSTPAVAHNRAGCYWSRNPCGHHLHDGVSARTPRIGAVLET
jgi:hypothetical protein